MALGTAQGAAKAVCALEAGVETPKKKRRKCEYLTRVLGSQNSLQDLAHCETEVIGMGHILFVQRLTNSFF